MMMVKDVLVTDMSMKNANKQIMTMRRIEMIMRMAALNGNRDDKQDGCDVVCHSYTDDHQIDDSGDADGSNDQDGNEDDGNDGENCD